MVILGSLTIGVLIILVFELTIRWRGHHEAQRLVRLIHERAEQPERENPYLLRPREVTAQRSGRIAMVAPFGLCRKMTVRSRMVPMAVSLRERGYDVTIFVPPWDCPKGSSLDKSIDSLRLVHVRRAKWMPRVYDALLFARLLRQVMAFQPDIVYGFKPIGYSGAVSLLAYILKEVPWIRSKIGLRKVLVDADDWEGFGGWADRIEGTYLAKFVRDRQERLSLRYCDAVTVVSEELENRAKALRKGGNSVFYVPNGLRADLWPEAPPRQAIPSELDERLRRLGNPKVLLLYTRFAEFKAERLITILAKVLEAIPNTALLIVGTSFDRESRLQRLKLLPLADQAGIDRERIVTVGWVRYRGLPKYWSATRVAIYPCDDTCINRAKSATKILELMAAGKAIVADNVGEIGRAIELGKCGLLVPPGDSDAFSQAVVRLLRDEQLQIRLGEAANKTAHTEFEWSRIVSTVERAIESDRESLPVTKLING